MCLPELCYWGKTIDWCNINTSASFKVMEVCLRRKEMRWCGVCLNMNVIFQLRVYLWSRAQLAASLTPATWGIIADGNPDTRMYPLLSRHHNLQTKDLNYADEYVLSARSTKHIYTFKLQTFEKCDITSSHNIIIYSPSWRSISAWLSLFCGTLVSINNV